MIEAKIQPQALELEKNVLGTIMIEQEAYLKISEYLEAEHFYSEKHKYIFQAIKTLSNRNENIDMLTVVEELKKVKRLEFVGGILSISELTNSIAGSSSIGQHARILLEKYFRREMIKQAHEILKKAYSDSDDIFETIYDNINRSTSILEKKNVKEADKLNDVIIENHKNRLLGNIGINSKFNKLNDLTNGYQNGKLYIIAARPSMGKTTFVINDAFYISKDVPAAFFSLEMSSRT